MPKRDSALKKKTDTQSRVSPKRGRRRNPPKPRIQAPFFPLPRDESVFRRAIEDSIISGIAAYDAEGRQTYANEAFCKMVGRSPKELLGREPPFVYWAAKKRETIAKEFREILTGKKLRGSMEFPLQRRNGDRFDALLLYSALTDEQGRRKKWVMSASDFTQQRLAEERLRRVNIDLEERVRWRTAGLESTTRKLEEKVADRASIIPPNGSGFGFTDLTSPKRRRPMRPSAGAMSGWTCSPGRPAGCWKARTPSRSSKNCAGR